MIEVKTFDNFNDLYIFSNKWNELVNSTDYASIFQTFEWFKTFIKYFAPENLIILCAFRDNELIGIAPLQIIELRYISIFSVTKLVFIGERISEYCDFILKKDQEKEIISSFINKLSSVKFDWLDLTDIPAKSSTPSIIRETLKNTDLQKKLIPKINDYQIYHSINTSAPQENYYKKFFPKSIQTAERRNRKFQKDFKVEFVYETRIDPESFEMLQKFNIERMKKKNIDSFFSSKINYRFLEELTGEFSKSGFVLIGKLYVDDSLASIFLCFLFNKEILYFLSGFDQSLEKYSIGTIHLKSMIDYSFQNGYKKFDFLRGNDKYKSLWHTEKTFSKRIIIIRNIFSKRFLKFIFDFSSFIFKYIFKVDMMRLQRNFKICPIFFFRKVLKQQEPLINSNYSIKNLNLKDLTEYPDTFDLNYYKEYENRFLKGSKCFALFKQNEIVHVSWLAFGSLKINEIEETLHFGKDEICIFDVFTSKNFRGKGIFPFVLQYFSKWALENKFKALIIYSKTDNNPLIKAVLKSGFNKYKKSTLLKFFGLNFNLNKILK